MLQDVLESQVSAVQESLFGAVERCENEIASVVQQADVKHRNVLLSCMVDLTRNAGPTFRARLLRFLSV